MLLSPVIAFEFITLARRLWPGIPWVVEPLVFFAFLIVVPTIFLARTKPTPGPLAYIPAAITLAAFAYVTLALAIPVPHVLEAGLLGVVCVIITSLRTQGITLTTLSTFIQLR